MKFLKRLISTALSLLISSLIIIWSGLSIVSSATAVNSLLASAGVYEQAAVSVRSSMTPTTDVPEGYRTTVSQVFERTITPAQVEVIVQPLLVDVIGWLDQPTETPPPQLVLNLGPVKTRLVDEFSKTSLTEIEKTAIISQVAKQIPDQMDLSKISAMSSSSKLSETSPVPLTGVETLDNALGPSNSSSQTSSPDPSTVLKSAKSFYTAAQTAARLGVVIMIGLFALLVWLGRKDGRKMFTRPAWIFFSAGFFTAFFWLIAQFYRPNAEQQSLSTIMNVVREIMSVSIWYGAVALAIGAVLYGLSFIIKKPPPLPNGGSIANKPTAEAPKPTASIAPPPVSPPQTPPV